MSEELDKIKADMAFYAEVGPLQEEFEAARESKKDDPERWHNAKQAFEEKRTYWRQVGEAVNVSAVASADSGDVVITPEVINADTAAPQVGGDQ